MVKKEMTNDMNNYRTPYPNELYHYGVLGMKWGVRKAPSYSSAQNRVRNSRMSDKERAYARRYLNSSKNPNSYKTAVRTAKVDKFVGKRVAKDNYYDRVNDAMNKYAGPGVHKRSDARAYKKETKAALSDYKKAVKSTNKQYDKTMKSLDSKNRNYKTTERIKDRATLRVNKNTAKAIDRALNADPKLTVHEAKSIIRDKKNARTAAAVNATLLTFGAMTVPEILPAYLKGAAVSAAISAPSMAKSRRDWKEYVKERQNG